MTVTEEYQVRAPMAPTHFFLIDVSQPAMASGATAAVCSSLARVLDDLPGGDRTQVGWAVGWWGGKGRGGCGDRGAAGMARSREGGDEQPPFSFLVPTSQHSTPC